MDFLKCLRKKKTNRNFQLCTHVCKQANLSTININWDIMINATNSKIKMSVSHLTQKMYCERVMRWATDTSSLESIGHWVQCWGIIFWVLSGTIWCKMGGSGTNPTLWIASIVYDQILNKSCGNSLSFLLFDWSQLSYETIGG